MFSYREEMFRVTGSQREKMFSQREEMFSHREKMLSG